MNYLTCLTVNGPIVILIITANAFFIFCMVCPFHGERIKQPLKLLLWSLICSTTTFLASVFMIDFSRLQDKDERLNQIALLVLNWTLFTGMYSTVWLNFFYHTQIVPAQRAPFIWIKKNIKCIIYCIWIVERIYSWFDVAVSYLRNISGLNNSTVDEDIGLDAGSLKYLDIITVFIGNGYFYFCLCVMVMSSCSTVVYLCRHMRRMVANGQPFSCPRFSSQVRVTGTGILQGVLYVFFSLWSTYVTFSSTVISPCSNFTVLSFYMAGTTFTLGAGQAVFRQRAADVWLRAAQWCRASKIQQSERGDQDPVHSTNI